MRALLLFTAGLCRRLMDGAIDGGEGVSDRHPRASRRTVPVRTERQRCRNLLLSSAGPLAAPTVGA